MLIQLLIFILTLMIAEPNDQSLNELLPGLWIGEGVVEFDGTVAIDCHHPDTPDVYLEMFVTAPDSREHESLVVSSIKPSQLHAALLAAGFEPGRPLAKDAQGVSVPAWGDMLGVFVAVDEADPEAFISIEQWVIHIERSDQLAEDSGWSGLVFAGSIFNKNGYAADRNGTLISLTSFGDEVIAPTWTVSSQADIDEPMWIANRALVPKQGARVRIRIVAIDLHPESHEPERIDINRDP